jgi:hypothetical protein
VLIYDKTGKDLLTSVLAVPDYRLKATSKTVIKFNEVKAGQPQAIRAWFYPGHTVGDELVYSKSRAHELAATSNVVVPAVEDTVYVAPKVETIQAAEVVAITPERKEAPLAIIQTTPVETIAPTPAPRAELPHTAGNLPMIALLAFGMIAIGVAMRRVATPSRTR